MRTYKDPKIQSLESLGIYECYDSMIFPSTRTLLKELNNPESNILKSSQFVHSTIQNYWYYKMTRYACNYFLIFVIYFSATVKIFRGQDKYLFCHNGSLNFKRLGNNCSVLNGSRSGWLWYSRAPLTSPVGATQIFLIISHDSEFRWINAAFRFRNDYVNPFPFMK